jgi:hypothetical protein
LAYDILKRIPSGQTTEMEKMVGLPAQLVDEFYSKKGLTGDDGKPTMNEADMEQFMGGVKQLGALLAMPKTATRNEWDAARTRYSETFKDFSDATMQAVDTYYTEKSVSAEQGASYLAAHPEVAQYLTFREQAIAQDPLLFRYYGSLNFLDQYYQRIMASHALETWPGIDKVAFAYDQVKANGGDTKAFLVDHPELKDYWNYIDAERKKIKQDEAEIGPKIPPVDAVWRTDLAQMGVIAKEAYQNRIAANPTAAPIDAMALPYIGTPDTTATSGTFNITAFLNQEAEKRWPGMAKTYAAYTALTNTKLQSAFLVQHPEVSEYKKWFTGQKKAYDASVKVQKAAVPEMPQWSQWKSIFDPSVSRLLEEYFATGTMSSALRKNLERTLASAGISDVEGWLTQMGQSFNSASGTGS